MAVEVMKVYPDHPHQRVIKKAVEIIKSGGLVVYPTDTIYGLGGDLYNKSAIERILRIKKASSHKLLSFMCSDLKEVSQWAVVSDEAYKIMRRVLPGPYTFVLRASRQAPKAILQKRKTVGIRIPDSRVVLELVRELGHPILSSSVPQGTDGYYTDPAEIAERFKNEIELIMDAGVMFNQPSTIVDFSGDEPEVIREGAGDVAALSY